MRKKIAIVIFCLLLVPLLVGCGVPTADYEAVVDRLEGVTTEKEQLEIENAQLQENKPKYFGNRVEIENWLDSIEKPTEVSRDVDEWFIYALCYQKQAIEDGYIISISYTIEITEDADAFSVTCDIITADGTIYYFDPDNAILEDSGIRISLEDYDLDSVPRRNPSFYESY